MFNHVMPLKNDLCLHNYRYELATRSLSYNYLIFKLIQSTKHILVPAFLIILFIINISTSISMYVYEYSFIPFS